MTEREQLDMLCMKMVSHDVGDPKRIQHFIKVSSFAALIARQEGLDEHAQFVLEAAGYIHDIGIRLAEQKYGYQNGKLQEELGPEAAREMLDACGFESADTDRICWLVAHHHSLDKIQGLDHQILIEADFLVNLMEHGSDRAACSTAYETYFKTAPGKKICKTMFLEGRGFTMPQRIADK